MLGKGELWERYKQYLHRQETDLEKGLIEKEDIMEWEEFEEEYRAMIENEIRDEKIMKKY